MLVKKAKSTILCLRAVAFWSGTLQKPKSRWSSYYHRTVWCKPTGFSIAFDLLVITLTPFYSCLFLEFVFVWSFVLLAKVWVCQAFIVNWLNVPAQRRETLRFTFRPPVTDFKNQTEFLMRRTTRICFWFNYKKLKRSILINISYMCLLDEGPSSHHKFYWPQWWPQSVPTSNLETRPEASKSPQDVLTFQNDPDFKNCPNLPSLKL